MSDITKETIDYIAKLARLKLSDEQEVTMAKELANIFGYIEKLKEVNTEGVEPTAQVTGLENVLRKDEVSDWYDQANAHDLVLAAPDHEGKFVKVKEVFKK